MDGVRPIPDFRIKVRGEPILGSAGVGVDMRDLSVVRRYDTIKILTKGLINSIDKLGGDVWVFALSRLYFVSFICHP